MTVGNSRKISNKIRKKDSSGAVVGSYLLVTSHLFLIGLNTTVLAIVKKRTGGKNVYKTTTTTMTTRRR